MKQNRPLITAILAMSADGKIADFQRSPARFGSATDKAHLETQIAAVDAVLFGAKTLHSYGTTLTVTQPQLLEERNRLGKSPQPIHIVITRQANFDPEIRFFYQPIERWLITTADSALLWRNRPEFRRIQTFSLPHNLSVNYFDPTQIASKLFELGIGKLALLGGGELIASFLTANLLDEIWLTICPLILAGNAPSPVAGQGFTEAIAPKLKLISAQAIADEVFLHYRVIRENLDFGFI